VNGGSEDCCWKDRNLECKKQSEKLGKKYTRGKENIEGTTKERK
jgi:hypothetical protein